MAAGGEGKAEAGRDAGTHVAPVDRALGEARPHVEPRQQLRGALDPRDVAPDPLPERGEQLGLARRHPFLGGEDLPLVLLELRRDVALGAGQGLPPFIIRRYPGCVGVGHLQVIPEDLVVAHLERRDAGAFPLPLLQRGDVLLPAVAEVAALVEFRVVARGG